MCALPFLAKPASEDLILVGGDTGQIAVWSVDPPARISAFPAIFTGVLGRLACGSIAGRHVVVAAELHRGRLAGYDARSGAELWLRSDVPPVLSVALAGQGQAALGFLRSRGLLIDLATGDTTAEGLRWMIVRSLEGTSLAVANFAGYASMVDPWAARKLWRIPDAGLGMLDVAAADGHRFLVATSSPIDPDRTRTPSLVREFDLDGALAWTYQSPGDSNVPWLGHDPENDLWLGVEQDPNTLADGQLIRWRPDGSIVDRRRLPFERAEYAFLASGRIVAVAPNRRPDPITLLDTRSGRAIGALR